MYSTFYVSTNSLSINLTFYEYKSVNADNINTRPVCAKEGHFTLTKSVNADETTYPFDPDAIALNDFSDDLP